MQNEILRTTRSSVTLNVSANKIDSYRRKEETQNTVRVYENGMIGVAGSLGEIDKDKLMEEAKAALSNGIPYPCLLDSNKGRVSSNAKITKQSELIPTMQNFLDKLAKECPEFSASQKIMISKNESLYQNSAGADMLSTDEWLTISLIFQKRGAGNLFDCVYSTQTRSFDEDAVIADCKKLYDAFETPLDIEDGEYPVFFEANDLFSIILQQLIGQMYASGASLLSGKLGQKVANDNFTLCDDRNPETNLGSVFFDDEGQIAPDYRQPLIKNGILTNLLVSKNISAMLGLPNAATSAAAYDGVPSIGFNSFYIEPTANSVASIAPGKAILVWIASGGDMTPDGHFATPAQLAFLVENGEIKGRLPEINISADFFDIIGKDYLGTVNNAFLPSSNTAFTACKAKVTK